MSSLGDLFPFSIRRERVESLLTPGCVIRIDVKFPELTKPKFLVLVSGDDSDYLSFLINSEIHPYIASKPNLLQCQVPISASSHNFLHHDSHIACHEVFLLRKEDVIRSILADPTSIKGIISQLLRDEIKAAVTLAKTIDNNKKKRIISVL